MNLVPMTGGGLPQGNPSAVLSKHARKELDSRQQAAIVDGHVAAVRIMAKGLATSVAAQTLGMLYREADFQSGGDTRVLAHMEYLIGEFTMGAGQCIRQL